MKRILLLILVSQVAFAQNLGVWGKVYSIEEENLLNVITKKASELETHYIQDKFKEAILKPKPVKDIVVATKNTSRLFNPSIVFGNKVINPLDKVVLRTPLLFINGNISKQRNWAYQKVKDNPQSKIILVAGDPFELNAYFDQEGNLCERFNIKTVPTEITQQGNLLLIEEFNL